MEDKLLTKYEVMDYLNISRRHFEKLVTEENLPIIKITQNKRYMRLSDLHRYLNTKMINKPQEKVQESQPDFQWKNIWSKWMRLNEFRFERDIESKIDEFGILSDKIDKVKMELSELSNRWVSKFLSSLSMVLYYCFFLNVFDPLSCLNSSIEVNW